MVRWGWALVLAGLVVVIVQGSLQPSPDARITRLDRFCIATRDAVRQDRRAFEGNDQGARERAYERFYEGSAMHHNSESIAMCLASESALPPLPLDCRLNRDWACLARLAGQIERLLH
jgi:hypothetical protein